MINVHNEDSDMDATSADAKRMRSQSFSDKEQTSKKIYASNRSEAVDQCCGLGLSQLTSSIENALPSTSEIENLVSSNAAGTITDHETQLSITEEILRLPGTCEINQEMTKSARQQANSTNLRQNSQSSTADITSRGNKSRIVVNHTLISERQGNVIIIKEDKVALSTEKILVHYSVRQKYLHKA